MIPADGHVRYMGNKSVTFAKDGTVLSGVIDNDVILQLSYNGYGFVRFKNDNLLTFDKFDIMDPECNPNNADSYPIIKIYNLGINLTF